MHDNLAGCCGQNAASQANKSASGDSEFHLRSSVGGVHVGHQGLAVAEQLHNRTDRFGRDIN